MHWSGVLGRAEVPRSVWVLIWKTPTVAFATRLSARIIKRCLVPWNRSLNRIRPPKKIRPKAGRPDGAAVPEHRAFRSPMGQIARKSHWLLVQRGHRLVAGLGSSPLRKPWERFLVFEIHVAEKFRERDGEVHFGQFKGLVHPAESLDHEAGFLTSINADVRGVRL